jgi:hypothetical protein
LIDQLGELQTFGRVYGRAVEVRSGPGEKEFKLNGKSLNLSSYKFIHDNFTLLVTRINYSALLCSVQYNLRLEVDIAALESELVLMVSSTCCVVSWNWELEVQSNPIPQHNIERTCASLS